MRELTADNLTVKLGNRLVLDAVSAALMPGQITAIVGPNGAGKSTLLACLVGLRVADSGDVRLGRQPISSLSPRARARQVGFIPQSPEVAWALEARILVGLGRTPHIGARGLSLADNAAVERAMAAAGVSDLADRDVTTLSGGERGRVLIARALAGEPDWLLADEPLAGLDPGHQLDAAELFKSLAHDQGRGVVLTLHDLTLAGRMADRVIVLAQGQVLADGDAAHCLTPDVLAKAYGVQTHYGVGLAGPQIEILSRTRSV